MVTPRERAAVGAHVRLGVVRPSDVYAVGADKGAGPLVMHFDGSRWSEIRTGEHGDLWWVQALADGPVLMGGAGGMVLRYDGTHFERLATPGLGRQTVYGVWGKRGDDFYAVGSASGRSGFVWHYRHGAFENEALPLEELAAGTGEPPGFFKVFGLGDDVWVVGSGGKVLHRAGQGAFAIVPTTTKNTLFTVHGTGHRLLAVGGAGNGVLLDSPDGNTLRDVSPICAGLIQGVFATASGDWASGERGMIYMRPDPSAPFAAVDHGLAMPATSSLHSIFVDSSGGVWSAGGNVLTPALDGGMLIHYGSPVPPVVIDDGPAIAPDAGAPAQCPAEVVAAGKQGSIARRWDEQALAAIRLDLPRPPVHARNLFHFSAAMWDAWAAYDKTATGVFVREPPRGRRRPRPPQARKAAISYAAYRVLEHRYEKAIGGPVTVACLRAVMKDLPATTPPTPTPRATIPSPSATVSSAHRHRTDSADDGSNEANDCADPGSVPIDNPPLVFDGVGTTRGDAPRAGALAAHQPGDRGDAERHHPAGWRAGLHRRCSGTTSRPFALRRPSSAVPWEDPGPAPRLGPEM